MIINIDDYGGGGDPAVKRCVKSLLDDGVITCKSKYMPNIYHAAHTIESGRMPDIDHYKGLFDKGAMAERIDSLKLTKLEGDIDNLKGAKFRSNLSLIISICVILFEVFKFLCTRS